jgi:hypothetical protein
VQNEEKDNLSKDFWTVNGIGTGHETKNHAGSMVMMINSTQDGTR